jgi:hypothetical protein
MISPLANTYIVFAFPIGCIYTTTFLTTLNARTKQMLKLLPVQVELGTFSNPTSRIITLQVIEAYRQAARDFVEVVSDFKHWF